MILKVSAAWSSKVIDCTLNGILNGCHGKCCNTKGFYPPCANKDNPGHCNWLGDKGCTLKDEDKPVKCLLYPFVINGNNSLVLHGRAITSICKECYNKGNKSIIETQRHNLTLLFGEDIVDRMIDAVKSGRDFTFRTEPIFDKALQVEQELEDNNVVPIPKSEYWQEIKQTDLFGATA
jgi:hypothetical protein